MNKRIVLGLLLLFTIIFSSNNLMAQYIEQVEEITAGNLFGYGARQMAMGGAGIMSLDGTALFYNPANLARIPRIEFNFGLSNQKYKDKSSVRLDGRKVDYSGANTITSPLSPRFSGYTPVANSFENSKSNTRINSAIVSVPYPTYRGSMVIGVGMVRATNFDKVFALNHFDTTASGGHILGIGDEFQSGGLTQWGAGVGLDLSPRIAFGGAVYLYTGKHNYNWEYDLDSLSDLSYRQEDLIVDSYLGFNAKLALSMRLSYLVAIGLAVETPLTLNVEEEYNGYEFVNGLEYVYSDYIEYDVRRPFVLSGGISFQKNNVSLLADIEYTDWSQLEYGDNPDMEAYNNDIKEYYVDVVRYRFGGEYVFPRAGLSLRAGYFIDPLPIKDSFINKDRAGFSFGAGILIDQVMTLDLAFVHASYERNSDFIYATANDIEGNLLSTHNLIVDEDISYNRLYLTAAYRF